MAVVRPKTAKAPRMGILHWMIDFIMILVVEEFLVDCLLYGNRPCTAGLLTSSVSVM
jgi:hypothetical protein